MMPDPSKYYIFYDGDCGFCNHWVQWILENDSKDYFRFAPLQSAFGQKFLKERNLNYKDFDTLYLWKPNTFYLIKSEAVFKTAKLLGGKFYFISVLSVLPKFITDFGYHLAAKNRRKFRKYCPFPTPEQQKKFIG